MTDKLVDLIGIGNLLESLVTEDVITCEERDQIMAKIAKETVSLSMNINLPILPVMA